MDRSHALGQLVLGLGPHQVHVAVGGAQVNRLRRVATKIQQGATGLVGAHGVGRQALELVDLALVIDLVLRPGLFENFHHLERPAVAVLVAGGLAGEIRRNHVQNQPPLQHVVQRGHGARQHDGLHLATADCRQKIHAGGERRHGGHKAQGVLANLKRRWAENVAVTQLVGPRGNGAGMLPAAAQVALGHAQVAVIIGAQRRKPGHLSGGMVSAFDRNNVGGLHAVGLSVDCCYSGTQVYEW